jgi:hypothetical protein
VATPKFLRDTVNTDNFSHDPPVTGLSYPC